MNHSATEMDWGEMIADPMGFGKRLKDIVRMLDDLADAIDAGYDPDDLYYDDALPEEGEWQEPEPTGYGPWTKCLPVDEGPDRRIDDED